MHRSSGAALRVLVATALAACAGPLAPSAASAAERPVPGCLGMNFEDAAGDPREARSGLDVAGGFITLRDRTTVVNVTFSDLDLAAYPQPDDLSKSVRVLYSVDSRSFAALATYGRNGSQRYSWGTVNNITLSNSGMAHPGQGGVIEMALPNVAPGATVRIGEIRTEIFKFGGEEFQPDQSPIRRTMDLAQGTTQVAACPAAPAADPAASDPDPVPPAAPAPAAPAPTAAGPPAAGPVTRRTVRLSSGRLRGGRVRLRGRTAGVADGARVVVLRGERVVARTSVRGGRFSVAVRRIAPGARLRARVAGTTSAPVRIRR